MTLRKLWNAFVVIGMMAFAFCAIPAGAGVILSDSFESPVVSGKEVTTAPNGWLRMTGTYDGRSGLANVDSGVFTTPDGAQAAEIWHKNAALTTADSTWSDGLCTGITYTVTFNVARGDGLDGKYKVDLIALAPGEYRYDDDAGTSLKSASGRAVGRDMSDTVSFTYTAPAGSPHLGKLLALQLETSGSYALIDNLVLSDDTVGDVLPPALSSVWPLPGATWVPTNAVLEATFNEDVAIGSGNIEIRRTSDNSLFEAIAIGSGQVSKSGRTLTITPSSGLEHGVEYYVLFDSGTLENTAGNDFELANTTLWSFTSYPDGFSEVFYDSFENPVVSGIQVLTAPDGWMRTTGGYDGRSGLANTNTGVFTTPYGDQAACTWREGQSALTTEDSKWNEVLSTGITYRATFNVAKASVNDSDYLVELIALDPGEERGWDDSGTVLASASGTATNTNMSQTDSLVYTYDPSDSAHLGKQLALQLEGGWDSATTLVDNFLLVSNGSDEDVIPPALASTWPRAGETWVSTNAVLEATFNEDVAIGSGNIEIRRTIDDSLFEAIAIGSGQVTKSGRTLTITPPAGLEHGVEYYVLFDSGTLEDTAGNQFELANPTLWTFTSYPDGFSEVFYDSFESPGVSGIQVKTAPDGWMRTTGEWDGRSGLANTNTGVFTTPYGDQAACTWREGESALTTEDSKWNEVLSTGITYRATFNVAKASDDDSSYLVELIALDPGEERGWDNSGTVLASASGTATNTNMSQTDSLVYTYDPPDSAHLGKQLALQLEGGGNTETALFDNFLLVSNGSDEDVIPPALASTWPRAGETWVSPNAVLEATFNEDFTIGSGNIEIRRTIDDSLFEAIAIDSGQVSQSGRMLTIDPSMGLEQDVEYYVLFDSGTLADAAGNDFELTNTSLWSFSTAQPDGIRELFYESFEDPVVSGLGPEPSFPTNGWLRGSHDSHVTLYNEDSADFSTPYGDQAFMITYDNYAFIVTDSNTVNDVYQEGVTYTLTFNVAVTNGSIEREYDVKLMYIPDGIVRTSYNNGGTEVGSASGNAIYSDMREGAGLAFTVPEGAPYIGKPIDIRINWGSGYCLVDNMKLTDDYVPPGTLFMFR